MTDNAIMSPVHPGEVLQEEYLDPLGLTQHRVAVAINAPLCGSTRSKAAPKTLISKNLAVPC